jgi:hypothetical protein
VAWTSVPEDCAEVWSRCLGCVAAHRAWGQAAGWCRQGGVVNDVCTAGGVVAGGVVVGGPVTGSGGGSACSRRHGSI